MTTAAPSRRPMRAALDSTRGLRTRPSASRTKVDAHDDDGHHRVGRRERHVVGDADVGEDHVADELRSGAADQKRRQVVAEGEREGEDRPRHEPGQGERQDDAPERPEPARSHVTRRLQVALRHALERSVDRQDHERQPQVREDEPHRRVREADVRVGQADLVQAPVQRALLLQDHAPGVDADDVARPERQQHHDEQHGPRARGRDSGHIERDREGEDGVRDGDGAGDPDRVPRDAQVGRVVEAEDLPKVREGPVAGDPAGERVDPVQAGQQQRDERGKIDDADPAEGRQQQAAALQPGAPPEEA